VEVLIVIVLVGLVAAFALRPLWDPERGGAAPVETADPVLADLEARKQAKYREIRDTELDRAQGKLDEDEFRRQDAELRTEAIAILRAIDAHNAAERGSDEPEPAGSEPEAEPEAGGPGDD
jgi:hypothetical protein